MLDPDVVQAVVPVEAMNDPFSDVAEAFSRKALVYDAFGEDHANLARMRQKVRSHVLSSLSPGDQILEINAGTGADAVFFARKGFRVHATDISPGMIAQIEKKVTQGNLKGLVTYQQCSFSELDQINIKPFQYVFSNMGGVNCSNDLRKISRGLEPLLVSGSIVTLVVMPPICPWELTLALRGNLKVALRRLSRSGSLANVEGVRFMTYYYTPAQVVRAFGPAFLPVGLQGLSVLTPTADAKGFDDRHPSIYRLLRWLDDRLSDRPPFNHWGDFFILTLKYLPHAV